MNPTSPLISSTHQLMAVLPAYAKMSREEQAQAFPQTYSGPPKRGARVAVVELAGVLTKQSYLNARELVNTLASDDAIDEILILVDSPGGHVAGVHDLYLAISRAATRKRVTAFVEDLAASGAYYAIAGATEIVMNPAGEVGSLGVYLLLVDASRMYEKMGIDFLLIRSGPNKGTGQVGVKITAEEIEHVQSIVDAKARYFVEAVAKGRTMSVARVRDLADGRLFVGSQALAAGLVDRLGVFEDILAEARNREPFWDLTGSDALNKVNALVKEAQATSESYLDAQQSVRGTYPELQKRADVELQRITDLCNGN